MAVGNLAPLAGPPQRIGQAQLDEHQAGVSLGDAANMSLIVFVQQFFPNALLHSNHVKDFQVV